jgi:rubrerythrin
VTFWLAVAGPELDHAQEVLASDWESLLDEPGASACGVLDFSQPTMTCPACNTTFDTGPTECPDCGLFIG